jgi:hypothetical protein
MSESTVTNPDAAPSREEAVSAMFAQLVMQHTNMAVIFLGLSPNPQTGEVTRELDHARYFIDQLEMLEIKTKGNLDKHEQALLKQSLTTLRMAFVEAVNHPQPAAAPKSEPPPASPAPAPAAAEKGTPVAEPVNPGEKTAPAQADEARKIFSKKYS